MADLVFPRASLINSLSWEWRSRSSAWRQVLVLAVPSGAGVVRRFAESIGLASSLSAADGEERNVLVVEVQHGLAGFQIHLRLTPAACIGAVIKAP